MWPSSLHLTSGLTALASIRSSSQVEMVKGSSCPSNIWISPLETCMCMWGELGLRVSCGVPGKGMTAVSPHQANGAMMCLAGGLTGALNYLHPSTAHVLEQRFWYLGVALWIGKVADGKGRLISPPLAWALSFLFPLVFTNYIAGPIYKIYGGPVL